MRKADRENWDEMIKAVRERFGQAVEKSGRRFTTDPFFMALLLLQQKMIRELRGELQALRTEEYSVPAIDSRATTLTGWLDWYHCTGIVALYFGGIRCLVPCSKA